MTATLPAEGILSSYRPGYSLGREFYTDPELYEIELDAIWRSGWLFVAVGGEIPHPGDYLTYTVGAEPIVVVRLDGGGVAAHYNVCRHRGSIVATEPTGRTRSFVCPYHQWAYSLDGRLTHCRAVPEEIDKTDLGLLPVAVREVEGLIFVSLADEPPDFQPAAELMGPMAGPQGFATAKVAMTVEYDIPANWKLVWENNRECFHCVANHPQYVVANYDRYDENDVNERIEREIEEVTAKNVAKWTEYGLLPAALVGPGLAQFPSPDGSIWYSANRTAMVEGYLSESMDGSQVAPLMGSYPEADVGVLRMRTLPNFWQHASCDHAVLTRLTPNGIRSTKARVSWLVDSQAEQGVDYHLDQLMPFWQLTSEQDWLICERQQLGVESHGYRPGPLSTVKEYNVANFHAWYLRALGRAS